MINSIKKICKVTSIFSNLREFRIKMPKLWLMNML
ncbi:hypothetical protein REIS_0546 [Rickettsia endosymbiont of Ixodes scapularis]|nr:hypothetical protein REIS_0546 [Rickettsia endosymbiont of Ixodes scapularis]